MEYTKHFADKIIEAVQELEDIGGPDNLEQYIAVLSIVKLEIEDRISSATEQLMEEKSEERSPS